MRQCVEPVGSVCGGPNRSDASRHAREQIRETRRTAAGVHGCDGRRGDGPAQRIEEATEPSGRLCERFPDYQGDKRLRPCAKPPTSVPMAVQAVHRARKSGRSTDMPRRARSSPARGARRALVTGESTGIEMRTADRGARVTAAPVHMTLCSYERGCRARVANTGGSSHRGHPVPGCGRNVELRIRQAGKSIRARENRRQR